MNLWIKIALGGWLAIASSATAEELKANKYVGVNLAGGEFGGGHIPGTYGRDYIYPSTEDIAEFSNLGMNTIRVPFLWERVQRKLNGPLDRMELGHLDAVVMAAHGHQMTVILDPHNYGSYSGQIIGSAKVSTKAFAQFWRELAKYYRDEPYVAFGLMNEPNRQMADEWAEIAQSAVYAIRKAGAHQLILVPGTIYSGAHSWNNKVGKLSNAEALASIKDPDNNFVIEMHQYFDSDSSGTSPVCMSTLRGEEALTGATAWLRQTGHKGFLGEFGVSKDPVCLATLQQTLGYLRKNSDVWAGWTYWAAAAWFGDYMFNIFPPDPAKHPQISVIQNFLPAAKKAKYVR